MRTKIPNKKIWNEIQETTLPPPKIVSPQKNIDTQQPPPTTTAKQVQAGARKSESREKIQNFGGKIIQPITMKISNTLGQNQIWLDGASNN